MLLSLLPKSVPAKIYIRHSSDKGYFMNTLCRQYMYTMSTLCRQHMYRKERTCFEHKYAELKKIEKAKKI